MQYEKKEQISIIRKKPNRNIKTKQRKKPVFIVIEHN